MGSYKYRPLDPEAHEIRLLKVQKSIDESAPITLELRHASLDHEHHFDALSYTWGDETPTTEIAIRDGETLGFVSVRRNLFEYLKEARRSTGEWSLDWIWIDQISINQDDQNERGHQVGQMRKLYSTAQVTLVWPWSWSESSLEATQTLLAKHHADTNQLICDTPERRAIVAEHRKFHGRFADILGWVDHDRIDHDRIDHLMNILTYGLYAQFLGTPYWERLWIIQEIVLARSYYLILSGQLWPPSYLVCTIQATYELLECLDADYKKTSKTSIYKRLEGFSGCRTGHRMHWLSWYNVLDLSKEAYCTKPFDRVYGVMGLLHESLHVIPDYSISEVELLRRVLYKHMSSSDRYLGRWEHIYELLQVWRFSEPQQIVGSQWDLTSSIYCDHHIHRTRKNIKRVVRLAMKELDIRSSPPFIYSDVKFEYRYFRKVTRPGYIRNSVEPWPWIQPFLERYNLW